MNRIQAVYYRAPDGSEPVREFIERLPVKRQVAIDNQMARLNLLTDEQPHLPHPYSSQVDGEFRELRCHFGNDLYRVLYRRSRNLIILLHVFAKRGRLIAEADKAIARERWLDFERRMNGPVRTAPRAAGRDAP